MKRDSLLSIQTWAIIVIFVAYIASIGHNAFGNFSMDGLVGVSLIMLAIGVGVFRPLFALLLAAGMIGMETVSIVPESVGLTVRPYQVLLFSAFLGWCVQRFRRQDRRDAFFHFSLADGGVALVVLGGFVSSMFSEYVAQSFRISVIVFSFALLYFIIRLLVRSSRDFQKVVAAFLFGAFFSSIFAIVQNISFLRNWGLWDAVMPGRPNAFFSEADWLGLFLAVALIVAWSLYVFAYCGVFQEKYKMRSSERGMKKRDFLLGVFSVVVLSAFIIAVSRSAWLAFLGGFLAMFVSVFFGVGISAWKRFVLPVISVGIATILVIAVPLTNFELLNRAQSSVSGLQEITVSCFEEVYLPNRIEAITDLESYGCRHIDLEEISDELAVGHFVSNVLRDDPNVNERKRVWNIAVSTIAKHPLFGVGWGGIAPILGTDPRGVDLNASNLFLSMWLGSGIMGVVGMLMVVIWLTVHSIRMFVSRRNSAFFVGVTTLASLAVFGIYNSFNSSELLGIAWLWLAVSVSAMEYIRRRSERGEDICK
jgi:O-antigen ligase